MAKENNLGLRGWFHAGRYGPQRYSYTLQRLSGIGIITYMLIHVFVTGTKIQGPAVWKSVMDAVLHPALHFGEFLLFIAIIIHAITGFRLIWVELGSFLGKPFKTHYPYQTCLDRNRGFLVVTWVLIVVVAVLGAADFMHWL